MMRLGHRPPAARRFRGEYDSTLSLPYCPSPIRCIAV